MKNESLPKCAYCDEPAELANHRGAGTFACVLHATIAEEFCGAPAFGPIPDLSFSWRLSFR